MWRNKKTGLEYKLQEPPRKVGRFWIAQLEGEISDSQFEKGFDWVPDETVAISLLPGEAEALRYVMTAVKKPDDDVLWRMFGLRFGRVSGDAIIGTDGKVAHVAKCPVGLAKWDGYQFLTRLRSPGARRANVQLATPGTLGKIPLLEAVYSHSAMSQLWAHVPLRELQLPGVKDWIILSHSWLDHPIILDAELVRNALAGDTSGWVRLEFASRSHTSPVKLLTPARASVVMPVGIKESDFIPNWMVPSTVTIYGNAPGEIGGVHEALTPRTISIGYAPVEMIMGRSEKSEKAWEASVYLSGEGMLPVFTPGFASGSQ